MFSREKRARTSRQRRRHQSHKGHAARRDTGMRLNEREFFFRAALTATPPASLNPSATVWRQQDADVDECERREARQNTPRTHTHTYAQLQNCACVCVCVCHIIHSVRHSLPVLTFCFSSSYNAQCRRMTSIMIRCHNSGWWDKKTAELRRHTPDNGGKKKKKKKSNNKIQDQNCQNKKIINDFTI